MPPAEKIDIDSSGVYKVYSSFLYLVFCNIISKSIVELSNRTRKNNMFCAFYIILIILFFQMFISFIFLALAAFLVKALSFVLSLIKAVIFFNKLFMIFYFIYNFFKLPFKGSVSPTPSAVVIFIYYSPELLRKLQHYFHY